MTVQNTKRREILVVLGISIAGFLLRLMGFDYIGVDYEASVSTWYDQIKEAGSISVLADFDGLYTIFYFELLYFCTLLPVPSIVSVKLSSILFDYLVAFCLGFLVYHASPAERKSRNSLLAYGLALCCPITVLNSAYLGQCESLWASLGLLAFCLILKDHPIAGMICYGFAFASKPQGVFLLPIILIFWYYTRKFSALYFLWIPVGIEISCIPAMIGGAPWYCFLTYFKQMMGQYPYLYYYYPNFWTFAKEAPYYAFQMVAIFSAFIVLMIYAVLFCKKREHTTFEYLEAIGFTAMTCVMLLPAMHERYNYLGELVYLVCAILRPKYRIPAVLLMLVSLQVNLQAYFGCPWVGHEILALINCSLYFFFAYMAMKPLWESLSEKEAYANE